MLALIALLISETHLGIGHSRSELFLIRQVYLLTDSSAICQTHEQSSHWEKMTTF